MKKVLLGMLLSMPLVAWAGPQGQVLQVSQVRTTECEWGSHINTHRQTLSTTPATQEDVKNLLKPTLPPRCPPTRVVKEMFQVIYSFQGHQYKRLSAVGFKKGATITPMNGDVLIR